MGSKNLTPRIVGGHYEVDFRKHGFPTKWHIRIGPASLSPIEAIHAAYSKLDELRRARTAEPTGQLELPAGAPDSFAGAMDEWQRRKEYATTDGRDYGEKTARAVRKDLGAYELSDFDGVVGEDRLLAYKRALAALAGRTVRNRFSIVGQVLEFAHRRHWIGAIPIMPAMPPPAPPRHEWIDEPTFRAVRAGISLQFAGAPGNRGGNCIQLALGETPEGWTERRRVYLSWAFYVGAHNRDCDLLDDSHVSMDVGIYIRHNSKNAAHVSDESFPMPEPLQDDLRALLAVLGREAWWCGEMIGGGAWAHADRTLARAQAALGIPGARLNVRILRRSFVREMARRGYSERQIADYMGHSDTRMIHEVYLRAPKPPGGAVSLWTRAPLRGAPTTPNTAARVLQIVKSGGKR